MILYYFAYGSNLHPVRLCDRVPSAEFVEMAVLPDHALRFCKRSVDGSAKATVIPALGSRVFGSIYRIDESEKPLLDSAEGLGRGYEEGWQSLPLSTGVVRSFHYRAAPDYIDPALQPYHWYKELVLTGARYRGLPDEYVTAIEAIDSVEDPDHDRRRRSEQLLRACGGGSPGSSG